MRTLALRLACLPQEDQHWVLSHLTEEHRAPFQRLRDEVVALGLNTDPAVIAQLNAEREQAQKNLEIDCTVDTVDGKALDLPPFWRSLLEGETRIPEFDHPEKLPPAMRASLYRLAGVAVVQRD